MQCTFSQELFTVEEKFSQVIYEIFDFDLTHGFFIHDFNKYLFYDDKFFTALKHGFFIHDFNKYPFYDDKFVIS